jgi:hypothetical protein
MSFIIITASIKINIGHLIDRLHENVKAVVVFVFFVHSFVRSLFHPLISPVLLIPCGGVGLGIWEWYLVPGNSEHFSADLNSVGIDIVV